MFRRICVVCLAEVTAAKGITTSFSLVRNNAGWRVKFLRMRQCTEAVNFRREHDPTDHEDPRLFMPHGGSGSVE